ncbi:MAG TPA: hypothetical protein VF532_12725 [Candidatus Angelobacter sp.]
MNKQLRLASVLLAAIAPALAQNTKSQLIRRGNEWVQEITGTLATAKVIQVKSSAGAIRVQGGSQENITYVIREHVRAGSEEAARREIERMHFTTLSSGGVVRLQADCEGSGGGYIDFEVRAPAQTAFLKLETKGGAVNARNIEGKVEASTGGGNIQLDQIGGTIVVSSGGGEIEIGKAGSDVQASTGGGNIHVSSAAGRVMASSGGGNLNIGSAKLMKLETGGGKINVLKCDGEIKAETGGGTIEITECEGPAQLESGGGGIKVKTIRAGLRAETGSGPIVATLVRGSKFSDSRLETSVGDIVVYVPDGLGVTVRAMVDVSRGVGIRSEFQDVKVTRSGQFGARTASAEGNINGGGPVLHVHTKTGNIEFRRTDKQ